MTEGCGQIFSGELKFCNEDSIIIGGEPFLRENIFSNFSPGFACLLPRFHLRDVLYRGDSHLIRGLILLQFFAGEITGVGCTGALRQGCINLKSLKH